MYLLLLLCIFLSCYSTKMNSKQNSKLKFCVDCKYFVPEELNRNQYGTCSLFLRSSSELLVTGIKNSNHFHYCSTARSIDTMCGKNATKYKKLRKSKKPNNETSEEPATN